MPKFIKLPVVIEAEQYLEDQPDPPGVQRTDGARLPFVTTIHAGQRVLLEYGDWIVPEGDGEHYYPIKDAIFRKTYKPYDAAKIKHLRSDAEEILKFEGELRQVYVSEMDFHAAMFTRQARDLAKAFLAEHPVESLESA